MKKKIIINQWNQIKLGVAILLNAKVRAMEKHYQLRNILTKLKPYLTYIIKRSQKI